MKSKILDQDHYGTLEVGRDSSIDKIKRARNEFAKKYHPDRDHNVNGNGSFMFKAGQNAYDTLMDPNERETYNQAYDRFQREKPKGFLASSEEDHTCQKYLLSKLNRLYDIENSKRISLEQAGHYIRDRIIGKDHKSCTGLVLLGGLLGIEVSTSGSKTHLRGDFLTIEYNPQGPGVNVQSWNVNRKSPYMNMVSLYDDQNRFNVSAGPNRELEIVVGSISKDSPQTKLKTQTYMEGLQLFIPRKSEI